MNGGNMFQGQPQQGGIMPIYPYPSGNGMWGGQMQPVNQSIRQPVGSSTGLNGRVVFSAEQIVPQEIPTNGQWAYFPLNDGSFIIGRCLLPNGDYGQRIYQLIQPQQNQQGSEFEQVMNVLNSIQATLGKVMNDLYGSKTETQSQEVVKNA